MQNMLKQIFVTLILIFSSLASHANQLRFVAEDLPPYHFFDANKKPTGALVDVVKAKLSWLVCVAVQISTFTI